MPHDLPAMVRDQVSSYLAAAKRVLRDLPLPSDSTEEASQLDLRKTSRRLRLATRR